MPPERHGGALMRAAVPILVAACFLFPRPLLLRTVLRLTLDEDLDASPWGRVVGLVGGFFIDVTLAAQFL